MVFRPNGAHKGGWALGKYNNSIKHLFMMHKTNKSFGTGYQAPDAKEISLLTEAMLCQSPDYGDTGAAGGDLGLENDNFDYGSF